MRLLHNCYTDMIGRWHHTVVCPSVCLWRCEVWRSRLTVGVHVELTVWPSYFWNGTSYSLL